MSTLAGQSLILNFPFVLLLCIAALVPPGMLFMAFCFYKKERKRERVAPITRRTTSSLPPEQTLVRASTLAPSQHETELLRAAQYGNETPAEQLLRAGQESREDV